MPVRNRKNRKRAVTSFDDWQEALESGVDGFGDLKFAGVETDEEGRPDLDEARAAWHRYGAAVIAEWEAEHPNGSRYGVWALEQFGPPTCQ